MRLTLAIWRLRSVGAYDDQAPGVTTPMRWLWNRFLRRHRADVRGRGLELGDARMIAALGGERMTSCEVLDIAPGADVHHVADLAAAWALPDEAFDVFLNQFTIHLIADDRAALWHSLRVLRPGGTLLVNFPCAGTAPPSGATYGAEHSMVWRWYTVPHVRAMLVELGIDSAHAAIEPLGGAAAIAAYLLGVPVEAMSRRTIEAVDEDAPLLIGARVTKPASWAPRWSPTRP